MKSSISVFLVSILFTYCLSAQSPVANFSLSQTSVCLSQNVEPVNTSANASLYEWDFCPNDFETLQQSVDMSSISGLQEGFGFKMVQDNGEWYGFAVSQDNHSIFRLDFGTDPASVPVITPLGNPGGQLQYPHGIDFIKEGGNWYAFVGFNDPDYGIVRLDFGGLLTNQPTATNMGMFNLSGRLWDLKIVKQGSDLILITVNRTINTFIHINFHNSFTTPVNPPDIYESPPITQLNLPVGMDLIYSGNKWVVLVASNLNNTIVQLNLGSDILSAPTVDGSYVFPSVINPYRLKILKEGTRYVSVVSNQSSPAVVLDFKDLNPANPPVDISPASMPVFLGIETLRWKGKSILMGINLSNTILKQLTFVSACDASTTFSTSTASPVITYAVAGNKSIELVAFGSGNEKSSIAKNITASSLNSPNVDLVSNGFICAGVGVSFLSGNVSGGVSGYAWNFGDGNISSSPNPTNLFASPGTYDVRLQLTGSNGCKNFSHKNIPIYNQPVANFSLPAASPVCTNQNYLLPNTSTFDAASNPVWEWRVNGTLVSGQQNYTVFFNSTSAQDIRLKALLPGCSNEVIKNIPTVTPGPLVDFTVADNCIGTSVPFLNNTTGADAGYQWSFGDTSTSTQASPSHTYSSFGTMQVTLTASNTLSCQNFITKPLKIYSKPAPDFSVGLPPFSCSNSSTPFQNSTPSLTDSNISTWAWQFGDTNNGVSGAQNPAYIYSSGGSYPVLLTATSDKGCVSSLQKNITIAPGAVADFAVGPSCLNLATKFTDLSSGAVQTRSWQIGPATLSTASPSYTFTSPGDYAATLTVTSANLCSTFKTKPINVPVPPTLDFSKSNLCAGKNATFTDFTPPQQDIVVGWNWNFDGNSVTGNPAQFKFASAGTYNVKMTTTHSSGCKYTVTKNVLINATPVASFTATPDRGAAPLAVQFTNSSQGASSNIWKFYDKTIATSTQASPGYTFLSLGDYSAELTVVNTLGCSDVKTVPIKVLVPSVDLILRDFSLTPDPTTGKLKGVVTILNSGNIPVTSAEVALILANNGVVNETFAVNLSPGQSVAKTLSFTVSPNQFDFNFLCAEIISEKDIQKDNNRRCVNLEKSDYFFNPFPNPTSGKLELDWITVTAGSAAITIYDSMGKKMYAFETLSKAGLNQVVFDLAFLSSGLYYVTIQTPGSKKTTRFFRE